MKHSHPFPKVLALLTTTALIALTGCSSPSTNTQQQTQAPESSSATSASPTPTPVLTQVHHPNWSESIVTTKPLPEKWAGGSGWPIMSEAKVSVFGMKNSLAVMTQSPKVPAVMTTYDKNGMVVDSSPQTSELASSAELKTAVVHSLWAGGKPYTMMLQSGAMVTDPKSTKRSGWGVVFSSFDGTTGKMVAHGAIPVPAADPEIRGFAGSVHIYDYRNSTITRTFIDPATGKTDLNHDPEWAARVDGIDVTANKEGLVRWVAGPSWKLEKSMVDLGGIFSGKGDFLAIQQFDQSNNSVFTVIDPKTGQTPAWAESVDDPRSYLATLSGTYAGVHIFKNWDTGVFSFVNPDTGKTVKLTKDDTFKPEFIGQDGVVYGTSSAVKGDETPAYLDLAEGEPRTLGANGTLKATCCDGRRRGCIQRHRRNPRR